MAIVIVLLALTLLRIIVIAAGAALLIRPVRECPACMQATVSIQHRWLARLTLMYELRWCPYCRWEGLARRLEQGGAGQEPHRLTP